MKLNWKRGAAGILAALALIPGAQAAGGNVKLNGTTLSQQEAWIEHGTSYITLAAFARETGRTLSWDGKQAILEGERTGIDGSSRGHIHPLQRPWSVCGRGSTGGGRTHRLFPAPALPGNRGKAELGRCQRHCPSGYPWDGPCPGRL